MFQKCFKSLFSQFQRKKKTVSKELKTCYFSYFAFWLTGQWGKLYPPPPGCEIFFSTMVLHDLLRHIRILSILRAHFGLIRCIHRQINATGRLAMG